MDTVTRRRFLLASGVVGAGALAAGAGAYTLREILATAGDRPAQARTLVVITLYGGNDGLGTVIPHDDPAYQDARPALAYRADEVLALDDTCGLNPALSGLHRLYGNDHLAIVRGVGYPKPDRSHFRSMDIWQSAQPERPTNTGWLGRWLDTAGGDPRLAISFEPALPPLLAGQASAGAAVPLTGLALPRGLTAPTLRQLGQPAAGESAARTRAAACFTDLVRVGELVDAVQDAADPDADGDEDAPRATGTGGQAALAAQLDLVARCVEARAATRVFSASLGGFDTHADERPAQETLLGTLDKALTGFADRMATTEAGRRVTVVVYSEFGRRVRANASDGTDHGTASTVFLLGAGVRGGLHGEQPSLTDLDDGDVKHTTDFRDVYATVADRVLGADPARLLNGWSSHLIGLLD